MVASLHALACATLLVVVLVPHACMAASNKTTLQDRCESYASGDRSSFDYKYCAWTLQRADKDGAATATADALAVADLDIRLCVRDLWAVVASLGRLSRVVGADVWIQGVRIP